jgi:hypothetical protein
MSIESDYYWQSAQRLATVLGNCIAIEPDDSAGIRKIPPATMYAALSEMCRALSFMESDEVLYRRLADCNTQGLPEVKTYLHKTGLNIDELLTRFVQFEQAIIRDAKIDYDLGRIMIHAIKTKRKYLYEMFLSGKMIDINEVKHNVSAVRREVCAVAADYDLSDSRVGAFVWGRLFSIAGVKIAMNNAALIGSLIVGLGHLEFSLAVGAYMSEMAGGALMMLKPGKG